MTLFLIASLWLSPTQAVEAKATPAAALDAIKKQYEERYQKWGQELQAAKTPEEEKKLFETHRRNAQEAVLQALQLAKQHPQEPAAFDALEWIVTGGLGYCSETWEALDLVAQRHIANSKVGMICRYARIYRLSYAGTEALLRDALAKNPNHDVQGSACFALAEVLQEYGQLAKRLKDDDKSGRFLPAPLRDRLKTSDATKLLAESEALYERTVKKFDDVKGDGTSRSLGQHAVAALFRMRHLQIGKVAPEIEGEDIDGKRFKLSDYRGKVVVLDFWGHW